MRTPSSSTLAVLLLTAAFAFAPARSDAQIGGQPEEDDNFGFAVASGDFNNDGFDDAAIGIPGEDDDRGILQVIYGTRNRLDQGGNRTFSLGGAAPGERFGHALSVGDFNGDGFDDVAIGAPYRDTGGGPDAGLIAVAYGSPDGITANGAQVLAQSGNSGDEAGDEFGYSLAAGDFNGDGRDDLAIGIPGEDLDNPSPRGGAVSVRYGSSGGLLSSGEQVWHQDVQGVPRTPAPGGSFGFALAAGDFDGNGLDDLAVGVPGQDFANPDTGMVILFDGDPGGLKILTDGGSDFTQLDFSGNGNDEAAGDAFGHTLAAGDFDRDGRDDLAVGIPYEDNEGLNAIDCGLIVVFYGSPSGISNRSQGFFQSQFPTGANGSRSNDLFGYALAAGDFGGDGFDDLAIGAPFDTIPNVGVRVGTVFMLYGSGNMLQPRVGHVFTTDRLGAPLANEDNFGMALAVGDFNGDNRDDVLFGTPEEQPPGALSDAGSVFVAYSDGSGLSDAWSQYIYQGLTVRTVAHEAAPNDDVLALLVAGPNPASTATAFDVTLSEAGPVRLTVVDLLGREVAVVVDRPLTRGTTRFELSTASLPAGVYIARLVAGERARAQPFSVVR